MRDIVRCLAVLSVVSLVLQPVWAKGRRGDYVTTTRDDTRTAKPGSAANPNPAYRAPVFDSDRYAAPATPRTAAPAAAAAPATPTKGTVPAPAATPTPSRTSDNPGGQNATDTSDAPLPGLGSDIPPTTPK